LNASIETRYPQRHNSIFYAEIDDHGVRWGDTGRILARSRHSVASRVALDLPYWEMRSVLYRLTRMAFEMAREAGACFSVVDFMSCITVAKRGPLTLMNAVLAIIADCGRAIIEIIREVVEINYFLL